VEENKMEILTWPRIIYHLTDGGKKSEKGTTPEYTYASCNSEKEFELLSNQGWVISLNELFKPAVIEKAEKVLEPAKKVVAKVNKRKAA
jgi:beta-galactosidase beta subunit